MTKRSEIKSSVLDQIGLRIRLFLTRSRFGFGVTRKSPFILNRYMRESTNKKACTTNLRKRSPISDKTFFLVSLFSVYCLTFPFFLRPPFFRTLRSTVISTNSRFCTASDTIRLTFVARPTRKVIPRKKVPPLLLLLVPPPPLLSLQLKVALTAKPPSSLLSLFYPPSYVACTYSLSFP